jgi:hypothetical protein
MGTIGTGNIIYADDVLGANRVTIEAGENISTGDACYIKLDDGKAYISGTGAQVDYRANGIAVAGVSSGADVTLITRGKWVTTGLTDKEVYYLGAAGAISTTMSAVRIGVANGTTELYIDIVQDDRDSVGTIKAVVFDMTGVPGITAFWQLCDGTTISDAESPINGETIRDLNANNEFLRGADTSDMTGTGGTLTHNHQYITTGGATGGAAQADANLLTWDSNGSSTKELDLDSSALTAYTKLNTSGTALPPYMDVVWVIKIK